MPIYGFSEWRGIDGRTTRKTYRLQEVVSDPLEDRLIQAVSDNDAIVTALAVITEATLQDKGISYVVENYEPGAGKINEHALINVWAEDPENDLDVLSISQVFVPAPIPGIFMGTSGKPYNQVDPSDADLQVFIDALSNFALISDMEKIDVGAAVNGIEDGRRVSRKIPANS